MADHTKYTIQNREHQRRSRARRKDYVANLEARVRKFEQEGACLNTEIQFAARRVVAENHSLRQLLEKHGVSKPEIEVHVAYNIHHGEPHTSTHRPNSIPDWSSENDTYRKSNNVIVSRGLLHPAPLTSEGKGPREIHPTIDSVQDHRVSPTALKEDFRKFGRIEEDKGSQKESGEILYEDTFSSFNAKDIHRPLLQDESQHSTPVSADETSCENAARIIASMRGHQNAAELLPELGCTPKGNCMVKNVRIFQLVNE